jgi:hypothetical protein
MKKLLIIPLIFFCCHVANAQKGITNVEFFKLPNDTLFTKSNIERFSVNRQRALGYNVAGVTFIAFSTVLEVPEQKTLFFAAGIGLNVISYYCMWRSQYWLNKHAIELTGSGVVIRF